MTDLGKKSRPTSWFNGLADQKFGIICFEMNMVRMPTALSAGDKETKEIMEDLFRKQGFDHIIDNGHAPSISAIRIFGGWPLGIEGSNGVLLDSYGCSEDTNHLPHLVGIIPDTKAGEHSPGILKLLDGPATKPIQEDKKI